MSRKFEQEESESNQVDNSPSFARPQQNFGSNSERIAQMNSSDESEYAPGDQPLKRTVSVKFKLGPPGDTSEREIEISDAKSMGDAYDILSSEMWFADDEYMPDGRKNPIFKSYDELRDSMITMAQSYYDQLKDHPDVWAFEISDFRRNVRAVHSKGMEGYNAYQKRQRQHTRAIGTARGKIHSATEASKLAIRAQFLGGGDADSNSGMLWTMIDHMTTFSGELAAAADISYHLNIAAKIVPPAVTLANVVINWQSENAGTTGTALEGLSSLNNVVALAGAANSLFINPGYIVTAYIGPMLSAISSMLGKLQTRLIENNDVASEILGSPLYIGAEPGGKEMWNYMVSVFKAGNSAQVSIPAGNVYRYFDKYKDRIHEFNSKRPGRQRPLPLDNDIIFKDLDPKAFRSWIFSERESVWIMLYGKRDPYKAKPIK